MNPIKIIQSFLIKNNKELAQFIVPNIIFLSKTGSHLYGTNTNKSDLDYIGVTYCPIDYWVGAKNFDLLEIKDNVDGIDIDINIYDIRKWSKLIFNSSPNTLESLFINEDNPCIIRYSDKWNYVRRNMLQIINQQAYSGYLGYASAQLRKLCTKQMNKTGRQDIINQYGFDTKFAAHTIRLIDQGIEILKDGKISFPRPNKDQLLKIRNGEILNNLTEYMEFAENKIKDLKQTVKESNLPSGPDFNIYNTGLINFFTNYVL